MFLLSTSDITNFLEAAKQEGIEPRIDNAEEFAKKNRVLLLRHIITHTNIDISLGIMEFEEEMVKRSVLHEFDNTLQIRLPTPEDLIIMKAIAHRPKDYEDIRTLAVKYQNLDYQRIKRWVQDFAEVLEAPEIWTEVKQILESEN